MTIEELRSRQAELRAMKRQEEALAARGEGDNMALFVVTEELLEVNAQLRSLTSGTRRIGRHASADGSRLSVDRALYRAWAERQSEDKEQCSQGEMLREILGGSRDILTDTQLRYLTMWSAGATMADIGSHYGVGKTSVSRVIRAAKRRLQAAAEAQEALQQLDVRSIDLSDQGAAKRVLAALTATQAMYLYLYYGEWLSLREIARLVGIRSHQSVLVSIHTGLRNLGRVYGCDALTLKNMAALDELAYQIYQTIDPEQLLPEAERVRVRQMLPRQSSCRYIRTDKLPHITVEHSGETPDLTTAVWLRGRMYRPPGKPGRLLEALLARQRALRTDGRSLRAWLASVFSRLAQNLGGRIRWKKYGGKRP